MYQRLVYAMSQNYRTFFKITNRVSFRVIDFRNYQRAAVNFEKLDFLIRLIFLGMIANYDDT